MPNTIISVVTLLLLALSLFTSCGNNSSTGPLSSVEKAITQDTTSASHEIVDTLGNPLHKIDRFNELRKRIQGQLLYDTIWQKDRNTYMTLLSSKDRQDNEIGGIFIYQWKWGNEHPELQWTYVDTLNCDWQDLIMRVDLDSLILSDIDGNNQPEIITLYTLDCATDVSPSARHLVALDLQGKIKIKLKGWTKDPASKSEISNINLKYSPKEDDYDIIQYEGKIENYQELNKLSASSKKLLIDLWKQALAKDAARSAP